MHLNAQTQPGVYRTLLGHEITGFWGIKTGTNAGWYIELQGDAISSGAFRLTDGTWNSRNGNWDLVYLLQVIIDGRNASNPLRREIEFHGTDTDLTVFKFGDKTYVHKPLTGSDPLSAPTDDNTAGTSYLEFTLSDPDFFHSSELSVITYDDNSQWSTRFAGYIKGISVAGSTSALTESERDRIAGIPLEDWITLDSEEIVELGGAGGGLTQEEIKFPRPRYFNVPMPAEEDLAISRAAFGNSVLWSPGNSQSSTPHRTEQALPSAFLRQGTTLTEIPMQEIRQLRRTQFVLLSAHKLGASHQLI